MDDVKEKPFDCDSVPIVLHENGGGFDADEIAGGRTDVEEVAASVAIPGNSRSSPLMSSSRGSELTVSFEGEVYVFPSVTAEKMQAVLLLLGGLEMSNSISNSEFMFQLNDKACNGASTRPSIAHRLASLERFREKRKERCFEKKIRYNCRKEVALRMHRKNGQFASIKGSCKTSNNNWDSVDTPSQESFFRKCHHCGTCETSTPAMRRGPAGPRTLCNACGLMWTNKGTLRDLAKGGGKQIFDRNEPEALEIKSDMMEQDISYHHLDVQETPDQVQNALMFPGIPSVGIKKGEKIAKGSDSAVRIESLLCNNLGDQVI